MSGIFISYRRSDSAYIAGRLRDDLAERFGDDLVVFRDVETLPLGSFPDELAGAITACDAILVVIGDGWLTTTDAEGNRRLDQHEDWVRREIAAGLAQGKLVVPVLVEGARLPAESDLPDDIRGLVLQQAVQLPDARWDDELGRLAEQLRASAGVSWGERTRIYTGPWAGVEAPVRLTVEKIESAPDGMRFHLVVENTTTDELTLTWDTFDLTDDAGHQYTPVLPSPDWANDLSPGTYLGIIDVGQPLQPATKVLEAGWVRALGTYEVGSLYATVRLSPGA